VLDGRSQQDGNPLSACQLATVLSLEPRGQLTAPTPVWDRLIVAMGRGR
jgi:hypothetical protein